MLGFLYEKFRLQTEYSNALARLTNQLQPAYLRNVKECVSCQLCCWRRPPFLLKNDLERLAEHQNLSPEQFFKEYCVVDRIGKVTGIILRRADQKEYAGKWLPYTETYNIESPCCYLDSNIGCLVHTIKPYMCKIGCCTNTEEESRTKFNGYAEWSWEKDQLINLGWDGNADD